MANLFLLGASVVWGGAFVAGRVLVAANDPTAVAWVRFVLASLAFAALGAMGAAGWGAAPGRGSGGAAPGGGSTGGARSGGPGAPPGARSRDTVPAAADWKAYALLGLTGIFGYNLFFFYGLTYTTATESSLIVASSPVVVALLGFLFLGEKLSAPRVAGIALSTLGVVLVVLGAGEAVGAGASARAATATVADTLGRLVGGPPAGGPPMSGRMAGDLLMLGGVLCWAVYSFAGKRILSQVGPFTATARAVYWGTAFLTVPLAFRFDPRAILSLLRPGPLAGLLYLSLVCTVFGFVAWYLALASTEVSLAAVYLNVVPVSTLVIAWLVLGERPAWPQLVGGALVIGGVYLVSAVGAGPRAARLR